MDKELRKESLKIGGRQFKFEDYHGQDTVSKGLATTHEQVSDTYTEGEINQVIENVDGKDIKNTSKKSID
ncbi:YozQ family protein [Siminovitchia sediminis]|uniref:YozQ family protein n=1 Tax=Siminovitchia sediminis TaxID=1274353 RepID=A0ABW4KKA9_9BACI